MCKYLVPRLIIPGPLLYLPFGIFKAVRLCFDEFRIYMNDFCEEKMKSLTPLQRHHSEKEQQKRGDDDDALTPESEEEAQRQETHRTDLLSKLLENNTVLTTPEIFGDIFIFLVAGAGRYYYAEIIYAQCINILHTK